MKLGLAIGELQAAELGLASGFRLVAERHAAETDVHHLAPTLAQQCDAHVERLRPFAERYDTAREPEHASEPLGRRTTGVPLLDDLRALFVQAQDVGVLWVMVGQAAKARRDRELIELCDACHGEAVVHMHWLLTRIKETAPQALAV